VELADSLGPNAGRFALGRAVLVACPNGGTPLASPKQFESLVTWIANLVDFLPDNPFTEGLAFVSEGLAWLAQHQDTESGN
jgi:hypothetical protein